MSTNPKSHHLANELPSNIDEMKIGQYFLDEAVSNSPHPEINSLNQAHDKLRTSLDRFVLSRQNINPEQTLDRAFMDDYRLSEERYTQLAKTVISAVKQASDQRDALDNDISNALALRDPPSGAEIRSHFKALPPEERLSNLMARADAGDLETLAAVLTQKAFLSGVTDEQQEVLRNHHSERNAPELVKRKRIIDKAIKYVTDAHVQYVNDTAELFPKKRVDSIKAKSKAANDLRDSIRGGF